MAKPFHEPANPRGQAIVAKLKEQGHWPITRAALRLGTYGFILLQKLLHNPSFRPQEATTRRLKTRLGIPRKLIEPTAPVMESTTGQP